MEKQPSNIKAVIGLGNPGQKYAFTRHNAGFLVLDALADRYYGVWNKKGLMDVCDIQLADQRLLLIKPQTFMNESGKIVPLLLKQGIKPENMLVVHDELEKPFGVLDVKIGGSHRGHNGLRSIMALGGPEFQRLRFGIGRPEKKEDVSEYVLHPFDEPKSAVFELVDQAVDMIERIITTTT